MSRNPIEMRTCATSRCRVLAALACCMAAGLVAGCSNDEPACESPHDEPTAFLEVRDRDGACTACNADGGLTVVLGLANGCDDVARFTTAESCFVNLFLVSSESGEMVPAGFLCIPSEIEWELQPGEVMSAELDWGRSEDDPDDLLESWGPPEPGHYRLLVTLDADLMTGEEIAPPVEVEIIVTEP